MEARVYWFLLVAGVMLALWLVLCWRTRQPRERL